MPRTDFHQSVFHLFSFILKIFDFYTNDIYQNLLMYTLFYKKVIG